MFFVTTGAAISSESASSFGNTKLSLDRLFSQGLSTAHMTNAQGAFRSFSHRVISSANTRCLNATYKLPTPDGDMTVTEGVAASDNIVVRRFVERHGMSGPGSKRYCRSHYTMVVVHVFAAVVEAAGKPLPTPIAKGNSSSAC